MYQGKYKKKIKLYWKTVYSSLFIDDYTEGTALVKLKNIKSLTFSSKYYK